MSLENVQVYTNFSAWRVVQITLPGALASIASLLAVGDQPILERSVGRIEILSAAAVTVSSAATVHATRVLPANVLHTLPIMNPLRQVFVSGTGTATITVYFS